MGDVDGDGVLDLIVGAGKDHAPEVVVYAGAAIRGKGAFGTELARFQPFDADARGGISVAAAQIDGTTVDNIIVGSGPGIPSEVKVYQFPLASPAGAAPSLFSTFKPYRRGPVRSERRRRFRRFLDRPREHRHRSRRGSPAEVKVFAFPLLEPMGKADRGSAHAGTDQPVNTASFVPFGEDYRGGVSLATGWLAGALGGAKRIIVSQLADAGAVKVFSSGSALDGGPSLYLQSPLHHGHGAHFREIASFAPFDGAAGARVATTSTTTGANLLVSGVAAGGAEASVLKYDFVRPNAQSTTLQAVRVGKVWSGKTSQPPLLGSN